MLVPLPCVPIRRVSVKGAVDLFFFLLFFVFYHIISVSVCFCFTHKFLCAMGWGGGGGDSRDLSSDLDYTTKTLETLGMDLATEQ